MPKTKLKKNRDGLLILQDGSYLSISDNQLTRKSILFYYNEKFFNKFLNRFEFKGLGYQQIAYIMRKFWSVGTIGAFKRKDWDVIKSDSFYASHPEEQIVFAPWVWFDRINIYDFPISCTFVNTRAVSFIPTTPFRIDEEAVIGYIQRNKKGVYSSIAPKIAQLVDIEMTIRTNLKTQKYPWIIGVTPEDKNKVEHIFDELDDDNPYIVAGLDDLKNSKALVSTAPYTLDKLYQLKQAIENEILSLLGINNVGMLEKKEHAIVDEVNANNQDIQESGEQYLDCLTEFFDRLEKTLGYKVEVSVKQEAQEMAYGEEKEETPEGGNENE